MRQVARELLRKLPIWVKARQLHEEGWSHVYFRLKIQNKILSSKPILTDSSGEREVHVLTWHRDYLNMLWSLKSFYHVSQCRYPLVIHDGGLKAKNIDVLRKHFPNCRIISRSEADAVVEKELSAKKFERCLKYRRENVAMRKVFDFFLLARGKSIVSFDSDVVFFQRPRELLAPENSGPVYNEDFQHAYSMSVSEIEKNFGFKVLDRVNSGIFLAPRELFDYAVVETWLGHSSLYQNKWVTEQTVHAMAAAKLGGQLLPKSYLVSQSQGISPETVCKHYPGYFRPLLYEEGMPFVLKTQSLW